MLDFIARQFRQPSGFLGRIVSFIMKKGNIYFYYKIVELLEIKQNDKILEIGYGHGLGINKILKEFDCNITGVDFSNLMFDEASRRNKTFIENKKAELFFGNFLEVDLPTAYYDKVFCINVIYFWNQLEPPFLKIKSCLKKEGVFCFYMEHKDNLKKLKFTSEEIFNKYSIEEVVDALTAAGFENVEYVYDKGYLIRCRN
jgi:ubiquinone/menaquinone biosynthesis C-methylase UbiE